MEKRPNIRSKRVFALSKENQRDATTLRGVEMQTSTRLEAKVKILTKEFRVLSVLLTEMAYMTG